MTYREMAAWIRDPRTELNPNDAAKWDVILAALDSLANVTEAPDRITDFLRDEKGYAETAGDQYGAEGFEAARLLIGSLRVAFNDIAGKAALYEHLRSCHRVDFRTRDASLGVHHTDGSAVGDTLDAAILRHFVESKRDPE